MHLVCADASLARIAKSGTPAIGDQKHSERESPTAAFASFGHHGLSALDSFHPWRGTCFKGRLSARERSLAVLLPFEVEKLSYGRIGYARRADRIILGFNRDIIQVL